MRKILYLLIFIVYIFHFYDLRSQVYDADDSCGYIKKARDYSQVSFSDKPITKGWMKINSFSDEFNGINIDEKKWDIQDSTCHAGSYQAVTDLSMSKVNNGNLVLSLEKLPEGDSIKCENWINTTYYYYKTGVIKSIEKIRYGYIEIRCRFPNNVAMRPCFWLHGGHWVNGQGFTILDEIDVVERPEYNANNHRDTISTLILQNFYHNIGLPGKTSLSYDIQLESSHLGVWNTYAVEWLPEEVYFYVNGNITSSIRYSGDDYNPNLLSGSDFTCTNFTYAIPQNIEISLSLGERIESCTNCQDFSENFLVDYVRSYKLVKGFDSEYWPSSFSVTDYSMFKVHKSIKLGGDTSHTAIIPAGDDITIWAEEGIILDKGFEVSGNTNFSARVIRTAEELFCEDENVGVDPNLPPVY